MSRRDVRGLCIGRVTQAPLHVPAESNSMIAYFMHTPPKWHGSHEEKAEDSKSRGSRGYKARAVILIMI